MTIRFPSQEFDDAVAAVCHGSVSDEQARALNQLLRSDTAARDEYILRLEVHARLASEPDLFLEGADRPARFENEEGDAAPSGQRLSPPAMKQRERRAPVVAGLMALAACIALLGMGWWKLRSPGRTERPGATSRAVAMLNQVADAQWEPRGDAPRLGAPLEPGVLRLKAGLAQIVFYSGVRVAMEGPAELELISPTEASYHSGRLTAEVPPQARGFRVRTPQMNVTDLGTVFGLDVKERRTELHVFTGSVEFEARGGAPTRNLQAGAGAVVDGSRPPLMILADRAAFQSLFDLQAKSSVAGTLRYDQWREASARLNRDPSLLVHLEFDRAEPSDWRLRNASERRDLAVDATIVGCHWIEGRWPDKRGLEFGGVSDRVRLGVPGEYESLTLVAWVRVQGLDRRVNSLFMSDGFEPGTLHWLILNDGAPTLTVIGPPGSPLQIVSGPPVLALDKFGMWQHVAVVVDSRAGQVTHYLNGRVVSETPLKIKPPFRIGEAELGNWNPSGFKGDDSLMIRNFSGAMDEFCLFSRALPPDEMRALYSQGKPQPDPVASNE
jgi:hypothetical protein